MILITWCAWTYHIIFNSWSCVLVIWWFWYTTLLVQGASCSFFSRHSIHTWPYFTWFSVLLLLLVFYLSVYITVRFIIHSFECTTYITLLLSHVHIIVSSFRVCTCWSISDGPWFFSIRAWGDQRATVRRNPGKLLSVSLKFLVLCILAFCLIVMTQCQNYIFCISVLLCFQSCIQTKIIVDVCLLCENETSDCLLYMCARIWLLYYSVRYSRKRFPSSWHLLAIVTYPYSVFWEARRDIVLLVWEPGLF